MTEKKNAIQLRRLFPSYTRSHLAKKKLEIGNTATDQTKCNRITLSNEWDSIFQFHFFLSLKRSIYCYYCTYDDEWHRMTLNAFTIFIDVIYVTVSRSK